MKKRLVLIILLFAVGFLMGYFNYIGMVVDQSNIEISCGLHDKVNLDIHILVLDDIDIDQKVIADLDGAISFIENFSDFEINYAITESNLPHTFTTYDCYLDGVFTSQACVVVNKWDVDKEVIDNLPTATFYIFFWNTGGKPPLQAGSTWGVDMGIMKDSVQRPYATIPVDVWWYNQDPFEGFQYRSSQIISHEIINLINSLLEVSPTIVNLCQLHQDFQLMNMRPLGYLS